jgi:excisionase family DNA binding protein
MKGYLSVKQVAEALGVGPPRVRTLIARGQLPATKVGRDWFIRAEDFAAYRKLPKGSPGKPRKLER